MGSVKLLEMVLSLEQGKCYLLMSSSTLLALLVINTLCMSKDLTMSLRGYYKVHGGPTTYRGTTIPGIPNFYMIASPNTGTPTSTLFIEEVQVEYILQMIQPVLNHRLTWLTVKEDATDAYNRQLQTRLSQSVHSKCHSRQRVDGTGKIFNPFPWAVILWWWQLRWPR